MSRLDPSLKPSVDTITPFHINAACDDGDSLVALARQTRRNAEGFAAAVHDYSAQMPDHLDRLHTALRAFRACATDLRKGL